MDKGNVDAMDRVSCSRIESTINNLCWQNDEFGTITNKARTSDVLQCEVHSFMPSCHYLPVHLSDF